MANNYFDSLYRSVDIELKSRLARESLWEYRKLIHGSKMKIGWWQKEIAEELQEFAKDYIAGKRPILVIESPPQHGKSIQIIDFISWLSGRWPDTATIYASFSDRLGVRANLRMQRYLDSEIYKCVFPDTKLNEKLRNRELIEFEGKEGSFRNTTILGSITGESLDLGVIDDPIKGRDAAESKTIRDKTWDWFTDDFFTRFSESAGLLVILTRWHLDDPVGRMKKHIKGVKILRYPAIAEVDEPHRKKGEALFPEHKSLEFLRARKSIMVPGSWEALYQQNPVPREGGVIKEHWLSHRYKARGRDPIMVIQSYDCASKPKEHNDPTCGITFAIFEDRIEIWDVWKERLEFPDLQRRVKDKAAQFNPNALLIEDKDAGQQLVQQLRRDTALPVLAINPGGLDKRTRMETETPILESGSVLLPEEAGWISEYISEMVTFDSGAHDDQVDATSQGLKWIRENRANAVDADPVSDECESVHEII